MHEQCDGIHSCYGGACNFVISELYPLLCVPHATLLYRSIGAYESLHSSGCSSQRTLRDYTHYVKAANGFSVEVDKMLHTTANVE